MRQSDHCGHGLTLGPLPLPLLQEPCPGHEIAQQLSNQVFCVLIERVSRGIEPLGRVRNHHFRLVDGIHVQKDKHLPQMILSPRRAEHPGGGSHHRDGLPVPDVIAIRPGGPINGIFQDPRNGVVVLRGDQEDRVHRPHAGL